jgi:acetyl esterase/lipase
VPVVVWFRWPFIDMETHQNHQWMRSFMFDQGVATAHVDITSKASRALPELAESCTRALAEIVRQASRRGYDPRKIILAGWGWGSHPAALLATDPAYARAAGLPFESIRGILLIEPAGVDLEREHKLASNYVRKQLAKLAPDATSVRRYSPAAHLGRLNVPAALILSSSKARDRAVVGAELAEALRSSGASVTLQEIGAASNDLAQSMIGGPGHPENELIKTFLNQTVR